MSLGKGHDGAHASTSASSPSSRRRQGYSSIGRGVPDMGTHGHPRAQSTAATTHVAPDRNALESFDDLIRQEQQRSVSAPVREHEGAERHLNVANVGGDGDEEDLSSSTVTIKANAPADASAVSHFDTLQSPAQSPASAQKQSREESRWNGWHLWRMESYNRRVNAQQQALEERARARREKPLKRLRIFIARTIFRQDCNESRDEDSHEAGDTGLPSMTIRKMMLVTLTLAGVQVAWCLEFGYGTPYMLSIGLSKSATSLVWLAAPISGLVVQPIVGVLSDISTSTYRRRQFILGSAFLVALSTLVLAFSGPLASALTDLLHAGLADWDPERLHARDDMNRFLVVCAFISLDLSINGVQAASRALILDVTPSQLHSQVNAWGARMMHAGSIIGYAAGWYDLSSAKWLAWLGGGQFRKYSLVSLLFVAATSIITSLTIQEGQEQLSDQEIEAGEEDEGVAATAAVTHAASPDARGNQRFTLSSTAYEAIFHIWQSMQRLPRAVRRICLVQIFAHMGWFPFLVYITQWVIETQQHDDNENGKPGTTIDDRATEIGSFALLMFALVSLAAGIALPHIALSHRREAQVRLDGPEHERAHIEARAKKNFFGRRTWRMTLRSIWTTSLIVYGSIATVGTFIVSDVQQATILVASVGIPWAVAVWVPYALVMESVREAEEGASPHEFEADWFAPERVRKRRRESMHRRQSSTYEGRSGRARVEGALYDCGPLVSTNGNSNVPRMPASILARGGEVLGGGGDGNRTTSGASSALPGLDFGGSSAGTTTPRAVRRDQARPSSVDDESVGGTVLGIHNMSIVLPQLITVVFAAAILHERKTPGFFFSVPISRQDAALGSQTASQGLSVVWIIRFGGLASFVAAALTRLVPLTRTERIVLASLEGKPLKKYGATASAAPRFDDEASDDSRDEDE